MKTKANSIQYPAELDREAAEKPRCVLADSLGTDDAEIVEAFRRLGLDGNTAGVFSLLPLVYVAWAEGSVSGPERRRILAAAHSRGIEEGTPAYDRIIGWLKERPDERMFEEALRLIRKTLEMMAEGQRDARANRLIGECIEIAKASGGVRGFVGGGSDVCAEEVAALQRVAKHLVD